MSGRASIVGAAETSVGKVREHNEDAHFIDPEAGIFIVCDGMGGHAAGEVASNLAVKTIRAQWSADATQDVADRWLARGTPDARKQLITTVQAGVLAAHDAIVSEAAADSGKKGMGTTVVAAIVVGGDVVFAHCGDSRAYLVRDGITVQLTEDHTLLARLLAAGVDVDVDGDGARFKSMLTNALGIGHECKVSTFVVPVADGDRFLLCSDGITEYLAENEIGDVLTTMPSPARSAQRLVEIALQRGGGDNATALVVRVLEAGETARPSDQLRREERAIYSCPLWAKLNPQQRLRALRIALPRDHTSGEKIPAQTLGDRVAWILVEGELEQDGHLRGPGSLIYPEALLADRPLPDKHGLAIAQSDVRALALRSDDFRELCDDDPEIGEHLLSALGVEISRRRPQRSTGRIAVQDEANDRIATEPGDDEGKVDTAPQPKLEPAALAQADAGPRPAAMDPNGDAARGATLRRPAVDPDIARATTLQRPAVEPVIDLARANTLERPAVVLIPDLAHANTLERPAVVVPGSDAPKAVETRPRQPRGSTIPPKNARTRATTDHGTPVSDRAITADPSEDSLGGAANGRRAATSPGEGSRSSLIVPAADTAAAVDEALNGMTEAPKPKVVAKPTVVADDDWDAELPVEPETQPSMPTANRATLRVPAPLGMRPPAPPALRPPAPRAPSPPVQSRGHLSEPDIQIEELVEMVADSPDDSEPAVTLTFDDVDDSGRAHSQAEDSNTITLTVDEDPAESYSVEHLADPDALPRPKRTPTDSRD